MKAADLSKEETCELIAIMKSAKEKTVGPICWQYENSIQGQEGVVVSTFVIDKPAQQIAVLCRKSDASWVKSVVAQGWEIPLKTLISSLKHRLKKAAGDD